MPFSLHHSGEDQYQIFGNDNSISINPTNESMHHDQVFLDAACEGLVVRNVIKNLLFLPNSLLTLITYGLLSYSVRLHCANFHTPLPFLFYLYDSQNMKTRHSDLLGAVLSK